MSTPMGMLCGYKTNYTSPLPAEVSGVSIILQTNAGSLEEQPPAHMPRLFLHHIKRSFEALVPFYPLNYLRTLSVIIWLTYFSTSLTLVWSGKVTIIILS